MDRARLSNSLASSMTDFSVQKSCEGRFSPPSEYIRPLIRGDQQLATGIVPGVLARRQAGERVRAKRTK